MCYNGRTMSAIDPRLSDDEVVRLVKLYQEGRLSREEENRLGQWVRGRFYKMLHREEEADDLIGEACRRFWENIKRFRW